MLSRRRRARVARQPGGASSNFIGPELLDTPLDFGPLLARRTVARFRRHDEEILAEQAEHRDDIKKLITLSQRGRQDLEKLLTGEATAARPVSGAG